MRKLLSLPSNPEVRGAAFLNEDTVVTITPEGDVWSAPLQPAKKPELLIHSDKINLFVEKTLEIKKRKFKPAKGEYPRIIAPPSGDFLVINPADLVLVACRFDREKSMHLISGTFGIYYPSLSFSADGQWLAVADDTTQVFDTNFWDGRTINKSDFVAWDRQGSVLWSLDREGSFSQTDFSKSGSQVSIGKFPPTSVPKDFAVFDGYVFLACKGGILECWQISPFKKISTESIGDVDIYQLIVPRGGSLIGVVMAHAVENKLLGMTFFDCHNRKLLADSSINETNVSFSPSGKKLIAIPSYSSNPHPLNETVQPPLEASVWEF